MCKVIYMADPNLPKENAHTGRLHNLTEQREIDLKPRDKAITFWFECSKPITTLDELLPVTPLVEHINTNIEDHELSTEV